MPQENESEKQTARSVRAKLSGSAPAPGCNSPTRNAAIRHCKSISANPKHGQISWTLRGKPYRKSVFYTKSVFSTKQPARRIPSCALIRWISLPQRLNPIRQADPCGRQHCLSMGKFMRLRMKTSVWKADIRARNLPSAALAVHTAMQNAVIS
jgi:hypothetical protein